MLHQGRMGMLLLDQQLELIKPQTHSASASYALLSLCILSRNHRNWKPALPRKVLPVLILGAPTLSLSSRLIAMSFWTALPQSQPTSSQVEAARPQLALSAQISVLTCRDSQSPSAHWHTHKLLRLACISLMQVDWQTRNCIDLYTVYMSRKQHISGGTDRMPNMQVSSRCIMPGMP